MFRFQKYDAQIARNKFNFFFITFCNLQHEEKKIATTAKSTGN